MSIVIRSFIVYSSSFVVLIGASLVWDIFRHRRSFEIAARSPSLLCFAGVAHVTLVFLQIMAEITNSRFPCVATIWASYLSFGVISVAYILRAARLVVVYDRGLRRKYQRLVTTSAQKRCMAVALTPFCVASLIVQLRFATSRQQAGKCRFFQENLAFFLPVTVLYLSTMAAMGRRLTSTDDAFRVRNEIAYVCVWTAITSVARAVHLALIKHSQWWDGWEDTLPPTIHDLVACSATFYVSFYQPLKAFYGVGHHRDNRRIYSARRVLSDDQDESDDHREGHTTAPGKTDESLLRKNPETWGVVQMLRNDTMCVLLVKFCEQNLCGESVDFLVDVAVNYESLTDPVEQFEVLREIVQLYLLPGSANEVNVSNSYMNEASAWLDKRGEFLQLEEGKRAHVLDKQRDEIAKMLSENLLVKFKQTKLAISAVRALTEMAATDEGSRGQNVDVDMKNMVKASAAAEVARIQRLSRCKSTSPIGPFGAANQESQINAPGYVEDISEDALEEDFFDEGDSIGSYTLGYYDKSVL